MPEHRICNKTAGISGAIFSSLPDQEYSFCGNNPFGPNDMPSAPEYYRFNLPPAVPHFSLDAKYRNYVDWGLK
jgi:hypothetical protein